MEPKAFAHQARLVQETSDREFYAVFWEQGTGKTKAMLDTALELKRQGKINAVLVLAPNGVHRNWVEDELPVHAPSVQGFFFTSGKAGTKRHKAAMALALKAEFPLLAMAYSGFMTEAGSKLAKEFLTKRQVLMILDESTAIKSPSIQRTKRVIAAGKYAAFRRILTGTPVTNSPFDIYAPFRFLDADFWFQHGFANFTVFKTYFGVWIKGINHAQGRTFDQCVGYQNLPELQRCIAKHSDRVTKDQTLDLPPKLYSKRYFELTPKQRQVYDELKDQAFTLLASGDMVTASLAIVRLLRLQQVTCNYVAVDESEEDDERTIVDIDARNPRLECLMELLEEVDHSAIIWARFTRDIDQIMQRLGERAVRYDGKVKDDDRAANKLAFQQGKAQFFVGNPAAAGKGLTLTRARTVIYYTNDFKLENRLQSEDRAHRIGQEHPVSIVDIVAPDTVDAHIVKALRSKVNIAAIITGDQLREWI